MEITIQAALTSKQYSLLENNEATLEIPYGTKMTHKKGSRQLFFYCEDEDAAEELKEGLENSSIYFEEL